MKALVGSRWWIAAALPLLALLVACTSTTTVVASGPGPLPSMSPQNVTVVPGQAVTMSASGVSASITFSADASPSADVLTYVFSSTRPAAAPTTLPSNSPAGAGATAKAPFLTFSLAQTLTASGVSLGWSESRPPAGPLFLAFFNLTADPTTPISVVELTSASHGRSQTLSAESKQPEFELTFPAGDLFFVSLYAGQ